ncbi:hypothetical protein GOODEAATRI_011218, partial [Goodea atripinnis]
VNGAVNGSGVCPPTTQSGSYSASPNTVQASTKPTKNSDPSNIHRSSPQSHPAELVEKMIVKPKEKVSLPSTGTRMSDRPLSREVQVKDSQAKKVLSNPPTLVPLPCSVSPPTLSQNSPLGLQSSRTRTEGAQQHFSVIQSTGLAANPKPLALLTQPRRENSPTSSPIALTTSPRALSSTASPKPPKLLPSSSPQHLPLSLCSSPKPLSVPSPPHSTLPASTSPKPFGLTSSLTSPQKSSLKPLRHIVPSAAKSNKKKQLEASLAQISEFRLKQVMPLDDSC